MGYQALLFCADEKLASVVRQVFSELDFTIEAVQEPFAAVKKLMSQRYDAVVIDSENEQNASLLFKSARNSSSNQGSLAIALVEGQAGVTRAYRIGANLVLTKPINVEQARGTLRVARGLLRKNSDAAATAGAVTAVTTVTAGKSTPTSASSSSQPANPPLPNRSDPSDQRRPATMAPPSNRPLVPQDVPEAVPEFAASQPTMIPQAAPVQFPQATASTKVEEKPVAALTPAAQSQNTITAATAELHLPASPGANPDVVRNEVVKNEFA